VGASKSEPLGSLIDLRVERRENRDCKVLTSSTRMLPLKYFLKGDWGRKNAGGGGLLLEYLLYRIGGGEDQRGGP